jgi:hypothetical protein
VASSSSLSGYWSAFRARRLLRPRFRRKLARSLERLVEEIEGARPAAPLAVPVQREEVALARESLLALAEDIRAAQVPQPQGIAMAWTLLTDSAGSPLYTAAERGALLLRVEAIRACLVAGNGSGHRPRTPPTPRRRLRGRGVIRRGAAGRH